ncbi:MAG: FISUMP domain-containing protein [Candidatus Pacebacteria bacterium]|nr:FISUMP domain-containing protein [Candidatus Paceibacterota bacterium]
MNKQYAAFTLIEIVLVIGAVAILAGIVILAINPQKQIADIRDAQRKVDIGEINKALTGYQIDHSGSFPITFPVTLTEICDTGKKSFDEVNAADCVGYLNLSFLVPDYLVAIPRDPSLSSGFDMIDIAYAALGGTRYNVYQKNDRFAFWAKEAEAKIVTLNLTEQELTDLIDDGDEDPVDETDGLKSPITYQGYSYPIVKIGNQYWFAKNLNTPDYRNGDEILHVHGNSKWYEWNNLVGKWSYLNNGNGDNNEPYGKLYNWYAISDARGICPSGWHIPSISDWDALEAYLNGEAGKKLKVTISSSPSWDGDNSSLFSAVPGGIRWVGGSFSSWGTTYFWSSNTSGEAVATRQLASWDSGVIHTYNQKSEGLSVRCIKD